jgi:hypothetical protein
VTSTAADASSCSTTAASGWACWWSLAHLPATSSSLLAGQVTDREGPYGVLDLDAVTALAATLPRARRAG